MDFERVPVDRKLESCGGDGDLDAAVMQLPMMIGTNSNHVG
jgi:hypothetical protein